MEIADGGGYGKRDVERSSIGPQMLQANTHNSNVLISPENG